MLLTNFYKILKSESLEDDSFSATVQIQKEHPIFDGHFPAFPITPGVGMLQIIKELTETYANEILFLEGASNVKFLALVDPNINSTLTFNLLFNEDDINIKVKNTTSFEDGTLVLKCNATFAKR